MMVFSYYRGCCCVPGKANGQKEKVIRVTNLPLPSDRRQRPCKEILSCQISMRDITFCEVVTTVSSLAQVCDELVEKDKHERRRNRAHCHLGEVFTHHWCQNFQRVRFHSVGLIIKNELVCSTRYSTSIDSTGWMFFFVVGSLFSSILSTRLSD